MKSVKSGQFVSSFPTNKAKRMRNLTGGLLGSIVAAYVIALLIGPSPIDYPAPYDSLKTLFDGAVHIRTTITALLNSGTLTEYLTAFVLGGMLIGLASKPGWNILRTTIWSGVILTGLVLGSVLLTQPEFWSSETRNWELLIMLLSCLSISQVYLVSAVPIRLILTKLRTPAEIPSPGLIQTTCECGAVFKSNPVLCSVCGRTLRDIQT